MAKEIYGKKIRALSVLWVDGIMNNMVTFDEVPKVLKGEVAYYLIYLDLEDLITDEEYKAAAKEEFENNKAANN